MKKFGHLLGDSVNQTDPPTRKLHTMEAWRANSAELLATAINEPPWTSNIPPEDNSPPIHPGSPGVQVTSLLLCRHPNNHRAQPRGRLFWIGAEDNTTCPCGARYSTKHILLRCCLLRPHHHLLGNLPFHLIFQSREGGRGFAAFLHATQVLLRPLPPRPDSP